MKESRSKKRISADWDDFVVKVFQKNGKPEYLLAQVVDISEFGFRALSTNKKGVSVEDFINGNVESELVQAKLRYDAKVVWVREMENGIEFGVKFNSEMLLPDVFIARSMAAA